MSIVEKLKNEHAELRRVADELNRLVAGMTPCDPGALARCRWQLARLVIQHLAGEDREIYSRPHDPASPLGITASRLKDELGGLYSTFHLHIATWSGEAAIRDWKAYRAETRSLLKTLADRIDREERDLYPLVEAGESRAKAA